MGRGVQSDGFSVERSNQASVKSDGFLSLQATGGDNKGGVVTVGGAKNIAAFESTTETVYDGTVLGGGSGIWAPGYGTGAGAGSGSYKSPGGLFQHSESTASQGVTQPASSTASTTVHTDVNGNVERYPFDSLDPGEKMEDTPLYIAYHKFLANNPEHKSAVTLEIFARQMEMDMYTGHYFTIKSEGTAHLHAGTWYTLDSGERLQWLEDGSSILLSQDGQTKVTTNVSGKKYTTKKDADGHWVPVGDVDPDTQLHNTEALNDRLKGLTGENISTMIASSEAEIERLRKAGKPDSDEEIIGHLINIRTLKTYQEYGSITPADEKKQSAYLKNLQFLYQKYIWLSNLNYFYLKENGYYDVNPFFYMWSPRKRNTEALDKAYREYFTGWAGPDKLTKEQFALANGFDPRGEFELDENGNYKLNLGVGEQKKFNDLYRGGVDEVNNEIEAELRRMQKDFPLLYTIFPALELQIQQSAHEGWRNMWRNLTWMEGAGESGRKGLVYNHRASEAEYGAAQWEHAWNQLNPLSESHLATRAINAWHSGGNVLTKLLGVLGSWGAFWVDDVFGWRHIRAWMVTEGINDDELFGNHEATQVISNPVGAAIAAVGEGLHIKDVTKSLREAGLKKEADFLEQSAKELGMWSFKEFLESDIDWGGGMSNTLQLLLDFGAEGVVRNRSSGAIANYENVPQNSDLALLYSIYFKNTADTVPLTIKEYAVQLGYSPRTGKKIEGDTPSSNTGASSKPSASDALADAKPSASGPSSESKNSGDTPAESKNNDGDEGAESKNNDGDEGAESKNNDGDEGAESKNNDGDEDGYKMEEEDMDSPDEVFKPPDDNPPFSKPGEGDGFVPVIDTPPALQQRLNALRREGDPPIYLENPPPPQASGPPTLSEPPHTTTPFQPAESLMNPGLYDRYHQNQFVGSDHINAFGEEFNELAEPNLNLMRETVDEVRLERLIDQYNEILERLKDPNLPTDEFIKLTQKAEILSERIETLEEEIANKPRHITPFIPSESLMNERLFHEYHQNQHVGSDHINAFGEEFNRLAEPNLESARAFVNDFRSQYRLDTLIEEYNGILERLNDPNLRTDDFIRLTGLAEDLENRIEATENGVTLQKISTEMDRLNSLHKGLSEQANLALNEGNFSKFNTLLTEMKALEDSLDRLQSEFDSLKGGERVDGNSYKIPDDRVPNDSELADEFEMDEETIPDETRDVPDDLDDLLDELDAIETSPTLPDDLDAMIDEIADSFMQDLQDKIKERDRMIDDIADEFFENRVQPRPADTVDPTPPPPKIKEKTPKKKPVIPPGFQDIADDINEIRSEIRDFFRNGKRRKRSIYERMIDTNRKIAKFLDELYIELLGKSGLGTPSSVLRELNREVQGIERAARELDRRDIKGHVEHLMDAFELIVGLQKKIKNIIEKSKKLLGKYLKDPKSIIDDIPAKYKERVKRHIKPIHKPSFPNGQALKLMTPQIIGVPRNDTGGSERPVAPNKPNVIPNNNPSDNSGKDRTRINEFKDDKVGSLRASSFLLPTDPLLMRRCPINMTYNPYLQKCEPNPQVYSASNYFNKV